MITLQPKTQEMRDSRHGGALQQRALSLALGSRAAQSMRGCKLWQVAMVACIAMVGVAESTVLYAQQVRNQPTIEEQIYRMEKEIDALQRRVFEGGNKAFFPPQEGEEQGDTTGTGDGAGASNEQTTSALLSNVIARVDAIESQLRTLTGQSEENAFKLRQLEKAIADQQAAIEERIAALEAAAAPSETEEEASDSDSENTASDANATSDSDTASTPPVDPQQAAARAAQIRAIEAPSTGNKARDDYTYGYRLWDAGFYPEARAELAKMVATYPQDRYASYAQNLIGRAYLDEGNAIEAVRAFYENYKTRPNGARAPHSLMYMGIALTRLERNADACKTFDELDKVYGERAPQSVRDGAREARSSAGC